MVYWRDHGSAGLCMIDHKLASCQRAATRIDTALPGSLVVPAEQDVLDCLVVNLSATGAGIVCAEPPPRHTYVVLRLEGLGDLEGVSAWFRDGQLGIEFLAPLENSSDVLDRLSRWIYADTPTTQADFMMESGTFTDCQGQVHPCVIASYSCRQLQVRTPARPALGSIVRLGKATGRVLNHGVDGILVQHLTTTIEGGS